MQNLQNYKNAILEESNNRGKDSMAKTKAIIQAN
jgi:hypothetical protein